ncbi:MAG: TadE/TadG family type IV pilus assembly protein [Candidatus Dormibacteria bacterium]
MSADRPARVMPRRCDGGQSTIEFALMLPLFLLCLLATVDAALWAVQSSATVSAAEEGARLAAAAAGDPRSQATPASADIARRVGPRLTSAMFGTAVRAWCGPGELVRCPGSAVPATCPDDPQAVQDRFGPRTVAICVQERIPGCAPPPCVSREGSNVSVRVIGYLASLVPPVLGLGWKAGQIPINVHVRTHAVRFNP